MLLYLSLAPKRPTKFKFCHHLLTLKLFKPVCVSFFCQTRVTGLQRYESELMIFYFWLDYPVNFEYYCFIYANSSFTAHCSTY